MDGLVLVPSAATINHNSLTHCSNQGVKTIRSKVPDTITQWIGNSVCLNPTYGLGISQPAALTAFQPFFVSMNLPYSVIRSEKLPVAVTVFNYQSVCMAVRITMNNLSGYTIDGSSSATKCVCGQDTVTQSFTIVMQNIGDVNVSISVSTIILAIICV